MTDLYKITNLTPTISGFTAEITFNPSHPVFAGHFPGQPVVPGVVLIEIATAALSQFTGKVLVMKEAAVLKFLQMIDPRATTVLLLDCSIVKGHADGYKADFRYYSGESDFAKFKGIYFTQSYTE